jgi:hypothetical protein
MRPSIESPDQADCDPDQQSQVYSVRNILGGDVAQLVYKNSKTSQHCGWHQRKEAKDQTKYPRETNAIWSIEELASRIPGLENGKCKYYAPQ